MTHLKNYLINSKQLNFTFRLSNCDQQWWTWSSECLPYSYPRSRWSSNDLASRLKYSMKLQLKKLDTKILLLFDWQKIEIDFLYIFSLFFHKITLKNCSSRRPSTKTDQRKLIIRLGTNRHFIYTPGNN